MNIQRLLIGSAIALVTSTSHAAMDAVCSYAPSQSAAVKQIIAGYGSTGLGATAILKATGLTFVAHSSGGYILTGSGGYVTGTLLSPLVVPLIIATTVAVGGTLITIEIACAPKNHPDAIKRVKEITAEFNKGVRSANAKAVKVRDNTVEKILELNEDAIVVRDTSFDKLKNANNRGIEIRDNASQYFAGIF